MVLLVSRCIVFRGLGLIVRGVIVVLLEALLDVA